MNKLNRLVVTAVVLVGAFVLVSRQSAADPHANRNFPLIVAKGRFTNQTAPISNSTIFTPSQTGLYRFSAYFVETLGVPDSQDSWNLELFWTDDAGQQNTVMTLFAILATGQSYGNFGGANPLNSFVFEAVAGQPFTFDVRGGSAGEGGTYALYYTVEQLQ
jgi:hypothetical protein